MNRIKYIHFLIKKKKTYPTNIKLENLGNVKL